MINNQNPNSCIKGEINKPENKFVNKPVRFIRHAVKINNGGSRTSNFSASPEKLFSQSVKSSLYQVQKARPPIISRVVPSNVSGSWNDTRSHSLACENSLITSAEISRLTQLGSPVNDIGLSKETYNCSNLPIGKYVVQRANHLWGAFYGDNNDDYQRYLEHCYNTCVDRGIHIGYRGIRKGWKPQQLICFCENWRKITEEKRDKLREVFSNNSKITPASEKFGNRRIVIEDDKSYYSTSMRPFYPPYDYAVGIATKIPLSKNYQELHLNDINWNDRRNIPKWVTIHHKHQAIWNQLTARVVLGKTDTEENIPLTYFIFRDEMYLPLEYLSLLRECPIPEATSKSGSSGRQWDQTENITKGKPVPLPSHLLDLKQYEIYELPTATSGEMCHPDPEVVSKYMPHIELLVEKALNGDLSVIPRIHWWYVHLAPTLRGSGGIAELLVHTLCLHNNLDLPRWRDGLAPAVETLLEPNEEKYCKDYHRLFTDSFKGKKLKDAFAQRPAADNRFTHSTCNELG